MVRPGDVRALLVVGVPGWAAPGVFGGVRPSDGAERRGVGNAFAKEPSKREGQLRLLFFVRRIIGGRFRCLLVFCRDTLCDLVIRRIRCRAAYFRRMVRPSCEGKDEGVIVTHRGVKMTEDWLDKIETSQKIEYYTCDGHKSQRIRFGADDPHWGDRPCRDCGVIKGEFHVLGCEYEFCPVCKQAFAAGCECVIAELDEQSKSKE